MKKNICFVATFFISTINFAQSTTDRLMWCKYTYKAVLDSLKPNAPKLIDTMVLDLSKNTSKYYSLLYHSGIKKKNKNISVDGNTVVVNSIGANIANYETAFIEINYSTKKVREYDKLGKTPTYYEDDLKLPKWKLFNDSINVLNIKCQKATTYYKGRHFTAWFAPSIPINKGPWLFTGLPGLILKIEDSQNQFSFICNGLYNGNSKEQPVEINYSEAEKITKKNALKRKRLFKEDIMAFSELEWGVTITTNTGVPLPKKSFNPISLEDYK